MSDLSTEKQLLDKAIGIKGKKYVLVSDRIIFFNDNFPNGAIITQKLSSSETDDSMGRVEFKVKVIPDTDKPERYFTGHSQAVWGEGYINKTSAMENAETSAVGRALAMMGIGVIDSVASVDEIKKTTNPAYQSYSKWGNKTQSTLKKAIGEQTDE